MTINSQSESSQIATSPVQASGVGRRRLLRAGLAATPVLLAVSGRSAMAGAGDSCLKGLSPLAWSSLTNNGAHGCVQTSHNVTPRTLGLSPGNWKPNGNGYISTSWPATCSPFDGYISGNNSTGYLPADPHWATGTKFNQIFTSVGFSGSTSSLWTKSFSRILLDNNGTAEWHLCGAYLDTAVFPNYPMTNKEVLNLALGKLGNQSGLTAAQICTFLDQTWS